MPLRELFPEESARDDWIKANAQRWRVSTLGRVEPDHPMIAVAFGASTVADDLPTAEADRLMDELEAKGARAYKTPTRSEFHRLGNEWKARDV